MGLYLSLFYIQADFTCACFLLGVVLFVAHIESVDAGARRTGWGSDSEYISRRHSSTFVLLIFNIQPQHRRYFIRIIGFRVLKTLHRYLFINFLSMLALLPFDILRYSHCTDTACRCIWIYLFGQIFPEVFLQEVFCDLEESLSPMLWLELDSPLSLTVLLVTDCLRDTETISLEPVKAKAFNIQKGKEFWALRTGTLGSPSRLIISDTPAQRSRSTTSPEREHAIFLMERFCKDVEPSLVDELDKKKLQGYIRLCRDLAETARPCSYIPIPHSTCQLAQARTSSSYYTLYTLFRHMKISSRYLTQSRQKTDRIAWDARRSASQPQIYDKKPWSCIRTRQARQNTPQTPS